MVNQTKLNHMKSSIFTEPQEAIYLRRNPILTNPTREGKAQPLPHHRYTLTLEQDKRGVITVSHIGGYGVQEAEREAGCKLDFGTIVYQTMEDFLANWGLVNFPYGYKISETRMVIADQSSIF